MSMRAIRLAARSALLGALLTVPPAFGEPAFDHHALPGIKLGLSFGGAAGAMPFELALQIRHRGSWAMPEPELETPAAPPALDLVRLQGHGAGLQSAYVFSHDLLADPALKQNGESSGGSNWVWWLVGSLAVTAAVVSLAGDDEDNNGNDPSIEDGCTIIGGNNISGGEVFLIRNCQDMGLPDVP